VNGASDLSRHLWAIGCIVGSKKTTLLLLNLLQDMTWPTRSTVVVRGEEWEQIANPFPRPGAMTLCQGTPCKHVFDHAIDFLHLPSVEHSPFGPGKL
jgi:hypothetical protein